MRFVKEWLHIAALSLLFISCEDDPTKPSEENPAVNPAITSGSYELITAHRSYFDHSYPVYSLSDTDYYYGMKISFQLNEPSQKDIVQKLILDVKDYEQTFGKDDLNSAFSEKLGGYVFDFIHMPGELSLNDSLKFNIKLYNSDNSLLDEFELPVSQSYFSPIHAAINWYNGSRLEFALLHMMDPLSPAAGTETYFANSKYEGTGISKNQVADNRWVTSDIPEGSSFYYYSLTDIYNQVKHTFISDLRPISGQLPSNVEYISEVRDPVQLEYIEGTDQIAALSSSKKQLILFNNQDNAIIWKREFTQTPSRFAYSKNRNSIYVAFSNGAVDSINPADGTGKNIYNCGGAIMYILEAGDFLLTFGDGDNYTAYYAYNFRTKEIAAQTLEIFDYCEHYSGAEYDSKSHLVYLRTNQSIFLYSYIYQAGILAIKQQDNMINMEDGLRTLALSPDKSRLYLGEGYAYEVNPAENYPMALQGKINPFSTIAFLSNAYIAAANRNYSYDYVDYPSSISVYGSDLTLLGKKNNLIGLPVKITAKNNLLKIYTIQLPSRGLIAQKFTIDEIINLSNNHIRNKVNYYKLNKL